jgi:hypothetical protein
MVAAAALEVVGPVQCSWFAPEPPTHSCTKGEGAKQVDRLWPLATGFGVIGTHGFHCTSCKSVSGWQHAVLHRIRESLDRAFGRRLGDASGARGTTELRPTRGQTGAPDAQGFPGPMRLRSTSDGRSATAWLPSIAASTTLSRHRARIVGPSKQYTGSLGECPRTAVYAVPRLPAGCLAFSPAAMSRPRRMSRWYRQQLRPPRPRRAPEGIRCRDSSSATCPRDTFECPTRRFRPG